MTFQICQEEECVKYRVASGVLRWYFGAQIAARAAIFENEQIHQTHASTTHQTTAVLQLEHHKPHKLMHTN
jgi:hypothetical protein